MAVARPSSPGWATPASTCADRRPAMRATWPRWMPRCRRRPAQACPAGPFAAQADKRNTLDLALEHLLAQAPARGRRHRAARRGHPSAACRSTRQRCTLCLSCVGACPAGGAGRQPREAATALHRTQLRAVRPVRHAPAPSARSRCSRGCGWPTAARPARRCACCTRPSLSTACAAASPSARCARSRHDRQARPATLPSRARRPAAEDVQRLPRDRHPPTATKWITDL
jgi:hypothetical protein